MAPSLVRLFPHALRKRWLLLLLGGAAMLLAMGIGTLRGRSPGTVLGDLAAARPVRTLSPRFSIPLEHHACSVAPARAEETVPRERCAAGAGRLDEFEALADAGESSDPDSIHASGLVAMLGDDHTEQAATAAITRLSRALRLSPGRASLLVDLSGAHLVRAQRTQNPRDLLEGLDYAAEALEIEPRNPGARFNIALLMQTLGLDEQAGTAWAEYLRIDSTSAWADEARERRSSLRQPPMAPPPQPGAPEAEVRAFARAHPQEAGLAGWDSVLGKWGRARLAGHSAEAAELLQLAERLGTELEARGRDASLADAVRAIRAAEDDPADTRALARGHRAYAAARALNANGEHAAAADSFSRAARVESLSPILARFAKVAGSASRAYKGRFATEEPRLHAAVLGLDSLRYPVLFARVRWFKGTGLIRTSHYAEARAAYQAAARLFERAGETENTAAQWQMAGEAAYGQRDTLAAYRLMHRALVSLRAHRSSVRLHNTLLVLANSAMVDQMPRAALIIQDEGMAVAQREGRMLHLVEALLGRARARWGARSRPEEALQDVRSADSIVRAMPASDPRSWLAKTVGYSRAVVAPHSASLADLDSAVAFFGREKAPNRAWLLLALLQRADVRFLQGDSIGAATDLDSATTYLDGLSRSSEDASARVAVIEHERARFDQLVMLHLHAGDTIAALQALERGRVSFAPGYGASLPSAGRPRSPAGQVAVEYALIGDTLLTWTVREGDVRLLRRTVSRQSVLAMIERSVAALGSPAWAASARPHLAGLHELLVRPIQERLGPPETPLVILADGEIAGVPFAALLDARGRYLFEHHPLRFAATLADAGRTAPAARASAPALLVADPAFDPIEYPTLDPLRAARAEVDSLREMYGASVVLQGPAATRKALSEHAPGAGVIHYAGHAVFDDARPERSALVLAGTDTTGLLTAEAVNALQLGGVRLVVLAACHTVRAREGRSGGLAGFSGALLAAGAGGVVGSLWQADDRLTQPLMLAFHRAYGRSGDPAAALRQAQLEMLRSSDPARRSPAAWAGFRYIGS